MPATYAHLQFSRQMAGLVPGPIGEYPSLYQVGAHGPDPLFYYNPFFPNQLGRLGSRLHRMSGREFFTPICRALREKPDPKAEAFAWGLLTHYCLDSLCHPYVNRMDREQQCGHSELETEFDRLLLEQAGEPKPHRADLGRHLRLRGQDCAAAAGCLPGVTGPQLARSVRNMRLFLQILGSRTILSRELLEGVLPLLGDLKQYLMASRRVDRLAPMTLELLTLYRRAGEKFPVLARQFDAALRKGSDLGEEFDPIFG